MKHHDFKMGMVHSDGVSYRCQMCGLISFHVNGTIWDKKVHIPGVEYTQAYTDDCDVAIIMKVQFS